MVPISPASNGVAVVERPRPTPVTTPPPIRNGWIPLENWAGSRGFSKMVRRTTPKSVHYGFERSADRLEVSPGSQEARWNGGVFWLGYAPMMVAETLMVHALDVEKNLEPLVSPREGWQRRVIVLDPGHGGDQHGALSVSGRALEKNFTLDWALRLRALLVDTGWKVLLTRTNDIDVPLAERVAVAERAHADIFLSLHFNATDPNSEQAGLETYCLTPAGMPSSIIRNFPDDAGAVFPNNSFDGENFSLAMRLHAAILQGTRSPDRGVRRARFMTVLRGQNRPAVLLEGGYLSNPREARQIARADFRQKLAEAVAAGLNAPKTPPAGPGEKALN